MEQETNVARATFYPEVYDLRPWYHDFSRVGLQTVFDESSSLRDRIAFSLSEMRRIARRGPVEKGEKLSLRQVFSGPPSSHLINQRHKEQIVIPLLEQALEQPNAAPSCLDLFCADGYYSCVLASFCPEATVTGVDLDPREVHRAQTAARLLDARHCEFVVADVWEFVSRAEPFDAILCTGGLYHLREPRRFLELLKRVCRHWLLIQSVVTLETEDPEYFVSPAPGWKHGSRFTHARLRGWLEGFGWEIVKEERNELTGNARLCDRGSSYFLCRAIGSGSDGVDGSVTRSPGADERG